MSGGSSRPEELRRKVKEVRGIGEDFLETVALELGLTEWVWL